MKTPPYKRQLQAALALTLLACSGLSGCSNSQEQNTSNTASAKAPSPLHTLMQLQPRPKPTARPLVHPAVKLAQLQPYRQSLRLPGSRPEVSSRRLNQS